MGSYCQLCGCRLYNAKDPHGDDKHKIMVQTENFEFQGGLTCGDCWNFLVHMADDHKDEFIHNKIELRKLRETAW